MYKEELEIRDRLKEILESIELIQEWSISCHKQPSKNVSNHRFYLHIPLVVYDKTMLSLRRNQNF